MTKSINYALTLFVLTSLVWAAVVTGGALAVMLWISVSITTLGLLLSPIADALRERQKS